MGSCRSSIAPTRSRGSASPTSSSSKRRTLPASSPRKRRSRPPYSWIPPPPRSARSEQLHEPRRRANGKLVVGLDHGQHLRGRVIRERHVAVGEVEDHHRV